MSAALARESLDLVDSAGEKCEKSRKGNDTKKLHGTKKNCAVLQRKLKTEIATSGGMQLSVEELLMRLPVHEDCTEANVHFIERLGDRSCLDATAANKIFERAVKSRKENPPSEPKEESTAFTEEDFKKFEEEYFVN